ncbi:dimethylarginine dimethylaminohydrolase family protein [Sphingosinicella terrae]|uniref:dimethylarginine dimethylaminohydrolase family protein n=1 Tax=Sphingosinicella terrae TaxID=2172047 RepID=UPI0025491B8C|nr:arginine deiminase family protein [Sphingosinicella terrae]
MFDFDSAIVRTPGRSVADGLSAAGSKPDPDRLLAEHRAYVAALECAGVTLETLPPLEEFPDSIFVEDPAFVLPEGAILLRSCAPTRAGEPAALEPVLRRRFDRLLELDRGFADGGDILILPHEILIGLSARTDREGAERFVALIGELGRKARIVAPPEGVLHLKSGCALVDEEVVVAMPALARADLFRGLRVIAVAEGENEAANLVRINKKVLMGADFPRTAERIAELGHDVVLLPVTEIRKIDAGLSCMSLRWQAG